MKTNGKKIQPADKELDRLFQSLLKIRSDLLHSESQKSANYPIHPSYQKSAQNLVHYLALRQKDILPIQTQLSERGLSSLGRSEKHVFQSINSVLSILARLRNSDPKIFEIPNALDFKTGHLLLEKHTLDLFGAPVHDRKERIMVTLPSEAAQEPKLVHDLIEKGMDCARINCAHDDETVWTAMIGHIRKAEKKLKKKTLILMDLPGEKIRTAPILIEPEVVKIKPLRNNLGQMIQAASVRLIPLGGLFSEGDGTPLPIPQSWLQKLRVGDSVSFADTRGASRKIIITKVEVGGYLGECKQTAYLSKNTVLKAKKHKKFTITHFHPTENSLTLFVGDQIQLKTESSPTTAATRNSKKKPLTEAIVGCTSSRIFPFLSVHDRIYFDDGKIGGVIQECHRDYCKILITHAKEKGSQLRSEKGINLPDTVLPSQVDSFVEESLLDYVTKNADLIALSFIKSEKDLEQILIKIKKKKASSLGIILKIETQEAFLHLPQLLLRAMEFNKIGIMIARGDLAIECGYERLAEIQEQILCLCEAAHVPVIWATQVLENLAKKGCPTRAEVTDASMAQRAECVMLNKGPYILFALDTLTKILQKTNSYQDKKKSLLNPLIAPALYSGSYSRL